MILNAAEIKTLEENLRRIRRYGMECGMERYYAAKVIRSAVNLLATVKAKDKRIAELETGYEARGKNIDGMQEDIEAMVAQRTTSVANLGKNIP